MAKQLYCDALDYGCSKGYHEVDELVYFDGKASLAEDDSLDIRLIKRLKDYAVTIGKDIYDFDNLSDALHKMADLIGSQKDVVDNINTESACSSCGKPLGSFGLCDVCDEWENVFI